MELIGRLRRSRLPSRWEHSPGGTIWRLQPTTGGILIGEGRDVHERRLSLFALRPTTGETLWSGLVFDEPWWIALETTIGDVAILHRYPQPDRPETRGCVAVDAVSGTLLWEDPDGRVLFGDGATALLQRGRPTDWENASIVDVRTGNDLHPIEGRIEEVSAYQETCGDQKRWNGWVSARIIQPDSDAWGHSLKAFRVPRNRPVVGDIEEASWGEWSALVAHAGARNDSSGVDSILYLRRGKRNPLRERLYSGPAGSSGDSMFIWQGVLMAVRDGATIIGLDLRS